MSIKVTTKMEEQMTTEEGGVTPRRTYSNIEAVAEDTDADIEVSASVEYMMAGNAHVSLHCGGDGVLPVLPPEFLHELVEFVARKYRDLRGLASARRDGVRTNPDILKKVDTVGFSPRVRDCLAQSGIQYIGELVQKSEAEMLKTRNLGPKSLKEIRKVLADMGLSFDMKLDNWPPPELRSEAPPAT